MNSQSFISLEKNVKKEFCVETNFSVKLKYDALWHFSPCNKSSIERYWILNDVSR